MFIINVGNGNIYNLYSYNLMIGETNKRGEKIIHDYTASGHFYSVTTSRHVGYGKRHADIVYQFERVWEIKNLKRFKEIIREINDLVEEAYEYLSEDEKEKVRIYWYSNIMSSLDNNHCFLSNCPYTMDDSARNDILNED